MLQMCDNKASHDLGRQPTGVELKLLKQANSCLC